MNPVTFRSKKCLHLCSFTDISVIDPSSTKPFIPPCPRIIHYNLSPPISSLTAEQISVPEWSSHALVHIIQAMPSLIPPGYIIQDSGQNSVSQHTICSTTMKTMITPLEPLFISEYYNPSSHTVSPDPVAIMCFQELLIQLVRPSSNYH
ncbi:hypothetical protein Tco_1441745 [Tanacetum coccineum]